jgi:hypothetical protein
MIQGIISSGTKDPSTDLSPGMREYINEAKYEKDNTREVFPELWRHIDEER